MISPDLSGPVCFAMKNGLLLINLGTPNSASLYSVGCFLREFLTDKRVISLPTLFRFLLVYGFILPFRTKRTTRAYQAIWSEKGSPLLHHSQDLKHKLQTRLAGKCQVALGMRYGNPSLETALLALKDCEKIVILPLYPQYSSAATGSSIAKVLEWFAAKITIPELRVIRDFHKHPRFIEAQAALIKPKLQACDYVLFSYHGLPENQLRQGGCSVICSKACPFPAADKGCYRAQCLQTTTLLAQALNLSKQHYESSFQSRLGKTAWTKPYTDEMLISLSARNIKNLLIVCPSFVTDCLETLEEIGISAQKKWHQLGGNQLTLVPCLNDSDPWINAIVEITNTI